MGANGLHREHSFIESAGTVQSFVRTCCSGGIRGRGKGGGGHGFKGT